MKMHHLIIRTEEKFEVHPDRGVIKVPHHVPQASELHAIVHDGKTYEIGEDLSFEVPDEVGAFFLPRAVAGGRFYEGLNPFAALISAAAEGEDDLPSGDGAADNVSTPKPPRRRTKAAE